MDGEVGEKDAGDILGHERLLFSPKSSLDRQSWVSLACVFSGNQFESKMQIKVGDSMGNKR